MKILVVAPHADDETLGCGGTLLKHIAAGDEVHWLLFTEPTKEIGFTEARIQERNAEIEKVTKEYGFRDVIRLKFPAVRLDTVPAAERVSAVSEVFRKVQPEVVYLPHRGDVHSDHAAAFDAVVSCTKWFRYPSVRQVLAYETLSETDAALGAEPFQANVFVDITKHLEKKLKIMAIYKGEMQAFPFPRSEVALRALAQLRGATAGCEAAEAFMLLRERR